MCDWTLTAGQFMPSNYWAMQVREGCITPEFLADVNWELLKFASFAE
jgi:hypothetical protein